MNIKNIGDLIQNEAVSSFKDFIYTDNTRQNVVRQHSVNSVMNVVTVRRHHIDGLILDCNNSSALAMELQQCFESVTE